ncbi:hypothetical protein NITHO_5130004 [Nitrolancea hollandica Lb]|uniref:Uncharacterized protein n=1 Tax=Nitrolancea hollandica Lb TaxID=1129897 RepID=I4ELI1_9BACT|nr:hypothetical protein NITHO_5130004 [Nitrolancea hollandica Lb]
MPSLACRSLIDAGGVGIASMGSCSPCPPINSGLWRAFGTMAPPLERLRVLVQASG